MVATAFPSIPMSSRLLILALVFVLFSAASPTECVAAAETLDETRLETTVLAEGMPRPLELDVAPDGRVFFIELAGKLKIYSPKSGETKVAATLDVFAEQENGLLGLTLDPQFAINGWIYLMYSPTTEVFSGHRISRFVLAGDQLDLASEKILLKVPVQRDQCCHHAGSLEFGPAGNLFISTGDNTHPFGDSASYAPLDERPGRHAYDAQDSAGNTADLRGKILRIRPTPEGGYTVPEGNLFPAGGEIEGCPEIYVMGCRNPWRMNIDPLTGFVYWGEVGPDAHNNGARGSRGYDELNQARAAGNFGWPFFIGANFAYADHDYTTGKTGPLYDPKTPRNISPTNTGSQLLPPAQPAWIYYPYAASKEFPMLGAGGRTACAGPVYRFDSDLDSPTKFPQTFDGHLIFFDWQRTFVKSVSLDADSNIKAITPFLESVALKRPVDMKFGPEGSLYVIDYGSTWGDNKDSRLLRIDYYSANRPPIAKIASTTATVGKQPLTVSFTSTGSFDKDEGDTLSHRWSVKPGDSAEMATPKANYTFTKPGEYQVTLTVRDQHGAEASTTETVRVGNSPPSLHFVQPVDGGFFDWGDPIDYQVSIDDAEDGRSEDRAATMKMRFLLTQRYLSASPQDAESAHLGGVGKHAAAVGMIKSSDCFNCHALGQKIVGPSFREIAARYAGDESAVAAAATRIIKGSSKVWGDVPMLPHAQFSDAEARAMVRWILSLKDEAQDEAASQSFSGNFSATPPQWAASDKVGVISQWEAAYTDFGAPGATPLTARAEIRLRTRQVEGEHFDRRHGTQTLESPSAAAGKFIGSIQSGHHLIFEHVNLSGIKTITARVASPSDGGIVQLRKGSAKGALVAEIKFPPTGEWEKWVAPQVQVDDPGGIA
ncbi:MAG: cytochrome c, partial [Verrucomicrobiales bacterium]